MNKAFVSAEEKFCKTENIFLLIGHGLPTEWRDMALGKDNLEREE